MKKNLNKRIAIACVVSFIFMIIVVYFVQSNVMKSNALATEKVRIADVLEKLETNDKEIEDLTQQLNSDYIAKADVFAEMVRLNPSIIHNQSKLESIAQMLDVEELHVTDDKGVIRWGTVENYFGFDFSQSDQAKEFMPILDDSTLKMAQEAQPNGTEGKYFQYVSVARTDENGIVQVGITPTRLQNKIENNSIANVLKSIAVGKGGYVFAVSKADGIIAAHKNDSLIGKSAEECGVSTKLLKSDTDGFAKIDGERQYCYTQENDEYFIIAAMSQKEVYDGRSALLAVFVGAILIMLLIIILLINSTIQNIVIKGMNALVDDMNIISGGNLDVKVDVRNCPEYATLSDGINEMLGNIKQNISETVKLNDEHTHLFKEVSLISGDIGVQSGEMQDIATKLSTGSMTQASTVEEISAAFNNIVNKTADSAKTAKEASSISDKTTQELDQGAAMLDKLRQAMVKIEKASDKISDIVKTIDEIAFQTNILALNATVEAARAGEHGKGFAVVSDEVRTLANKCAEATKNTSELIEQTKNAVADGAKIADDTAQKIQSMMHGIEESNRLIDNISAMADEQATEFAQISESMNQITDVVQQNAAISAEAETTARSLDVQAKQLRALFE